MRKNGLQRSKIAPLIVTSENVQLGVVIVAVSSMCVLMRIAIGVAILRSAHRGTSNKFCTSWLLKKQHIKTSRSHMSPDVDTDTTRAQVQSTVS